MRSISRFIALTAVGLIALGGAASAKPTDPSDRADPVNIVSPAPFTSSLQTGAQPKITPAQAQLTALGANPGSASHGVELRSVGGQLVYAVGLDSNTDVLVDAGNGKILYTEPDAHDGEDGEGND